MQRTAKWAAVVGLSLLTAGVLYQLFGPTGRDPGWSEHDYLAWALLVSSVAMLPFVAIPAIIASIMEGDGAE